MTPPDPSGAPPARLRVLVALRRGHDTVNALAHALRVTDNAVRGHLAALMRDGLVRAIDVVRTGVSGKPAHRFALTAQADVALSRAYPPVLRALMEALASRIDGRTLGAALVEAGERLAEELPRPAARPTTIAGHAEAARALLESLGGSARVEPSRTHADLIGDGCPLAMAVAAEPRTCEIVEALLAAHTGAVVERTCRHDERPTCGFRVTLPRSR